MAAPVMVRRLLSTRRTVSPERVGEYLGAWGRLRAAVAGRGGRAWLFRSAEREELFMEFLEWKQAPGGPELPEADDVAGARSGLDAAFGPGEAEEWREASFD